jgi:hypothetical protein
MTQILSSYIKENIQRLYYKDQPVNAAQRNDRCLFETHKLCRQTAEFFNVKLGDIYILTSARRGLTLLEQLLTLIKEQDGYGA